jgi:hypothetical protein
VGGEKIMRDTSDLRAWFREDIAKVLAGVNAASRSAGQTRLADDSFQEGFIAALTSVALTIGIRPENFLMSDDMERLPAIFGVNPNHSLEERPS